MMTERLARASSRRPWLTLGIWIAVIVLSMGLVATLLGGVLSSEVEVTSETESKRAERLLARGFPPTLAALDRETTEVAVVRFASGRAFALGRGSVGFGHGRGRERRFTRSRSWRGGERKMVR